MDTKLCLSQYRDFYQKIDVLFGENWLDEKERKKLARVLLEKRDGVLTLLNSSWIRENIMHNMWHKNTMEILDLYIWKQVFIEVNDFFTELEKFFTENYEIWMDIFKYSEQTSSYVPWLIWKLKSFNRNKANLSLIQIFDNKEDDSTEKKALSNEWFFVKYWDCSKASTQIFFEIHEWFEEKFILSFFWNAQELKKIENLFNESNLSQFLKAKLKDLKGYIDPLTWIYNQKYISAMRDGKYSLMVIDINEFKKINDENWHAKWDEVLINLWKILKDSVRPNDKVCRMWWDEFLIFIDSNNKDVIEEIKNRISQKLAVNNINQPIGLSCNISIWYEIYDEDISFEKRHLGADFNMYKSKTNAWKIHRSVSQFREFMSKECFLDNIRLMFSFNNEIIFHTLRKTKILSSQKNI